MCTLDKPWVSSKLKRLVARQKHALKFYGKNSPLFKLLRAQVQEEVRNCKRAFDSTKVASLKDTNISRWWSEVKSLGGLSSSSEWWHQLLNSGTPSVAALCDQFNNFLHSLTAYFAPLDFASLASESLPVPPEFLVSQGKAFKALRLIKANKSAGPDKIPSWVWKEFAHELAPVVCDLYNCSLREGCVLDVLKTSIVTRAPEVSPPMRLEEDLRPITLTSPLAKVLEGFTLEHLLNQVADSLDLKQFSVSGRSTTHALVYMLHVILEALDRGNRRGSRENHDRFTDNRAPYF